MKAGIPAVMEPSLRSKMKSSFCCWLAGFSLSIVVSHELADSLLV
jgi:hypothetical protein